MAAPSISVSLLHARDLAPARARIRGFLQRQGVEHETIDDTLLGIQEAAKNAIAVSPSGVAATVSLELRPQELHVAVADKGPGFDYGRLAPAKGRFCETGRGLHIIHVVMDDVSVKTGGGTTILMMRRLPAGPADRRSSGGRARDHPGPSPPPSELAA
jgi:anti-sigma regulatory factor (Ser/Thr protein kinase)